MYPEVISTDRDFLPLHPISTTKTEECTLGSEVALVTLVATPRGSRTHDCRQVTKHSAGTSLMVH